MKKIIRICCFSVIAWAAAMPAGVFAQETTPILTDKSAWSFVTARPAKNWTSQFPLPKGEFCIGELSTENKWPKDRSVVWMTSRVVLPDDYQPGNLFMRLAYDDDIAVFVNGTLVYQGIGPSQRISQGKLIRNKKTNNAWHRKNYDRRSYTKQIPNLLTRGTNVVAVMAVNVMELGFANVTMWMDKSPPVELNPLLAPDGKWSYTFADPGQGWQTRFPLPQAKLSAGPFSSQKLWPEGNKNIWITQVVTIKDLPSAELIVQYLCDDNMWLYINGSLVLQSGCIDEWAVKRNVKNVLKPGKNIIAARCENIDASLQGFLGVDIFLRPYADGEQPAPEAVNLADGHPFENLRGEEIAEETPKEENSDENLSELEKKIVRAMTCLKIGEEKLGLSLLEEAAAEDGKDFQANYILGMYYLTKLYKRPEAMEYFRKCVEIDKKNPGILNNYAVAAFENKKFSLALQVWEAMAKIDATGRELSQNVACFTELLNMKRIAIKEEEKLRLIDLYIKVCSEQNREREAGLGFLLMPLTEGAGNRPDCEGVFVQEIKRGKQVLRARPYEVKRTYFLK